MIIDKWVDSRILLFIFILLFGNNVFIDFIGEDEGLCGLLWVDLGNSFLVIEIKLIGRI